MILLTGVAGFIGMHMARRLLAEGHELVGIDHLGPCADPQLKARRLAELGDTLGRRAERLARPMPGADMAATCADTRDLREAIGWTPATPLREGIRCFAAWYGAYRG